MKPLRVALAFLVLAVAGCNRTPDYVGTYIMVKPPALQAEEETFRESYLKAPGHTKEGFQRLLQATERKITLFADGTFSAESRGTVFLRGKFTLESNILRIVGDPSYHQKHPGEFDYDPGTHTLTSRQQTPGSPPVQLRKQ